jgi:xanthine dehydrogenase accessory factor
MVARGEAVSVATVVSSGGGEGLPEVGAKMLLPGDGSPAVGSIHSAVDARILKDARRLIEEERSQTVSYESPAGPVEVFIESYPPPQHLVIVGAVHVSIPLAKMGKMLGYRVTVIDPREVFATPERFPDVDSLIAEWPEEAFSKLTLNRSTSVAVLTHDPKIDLPALKAALDSEAQYVGALGSRTTIEQRKADLREMGATPAQLDRIHAPIGLDIGSRTPAEIALATMAEIVAVRRRGDRGKVT